MSFLTIKILGACCILLGCGSFGFLIVGNTMKEIYAVRNFISALDYMICDLKYRSTPLPTLCRDASKATNGIVSRIFLLLAHELESSISADVRGCISTVLSHSKELPEKTSKLFYDFGQRMGLFDLDGQVQMLDTLRKESVRVLTACEEGHVVRSRSCKTIGVCAGAAIVILLI